MTDRVADGSTSEQGHDPERYYLPLPPVPQGRFPLSYGSLPLGQVQLVRPVQTIQAVRTVRTVRSVRQLPSTVHPVARAFHDRSVPLVARDCSSAHGYL